jgi:hypothetical protein
MEIGFFVNPEVNNLKGPSSIFGSIPVLYSPVLCSVQYSARRLARHFRSSARCPTDCLSPRRMDCLSARSVACRTGHRTNRSSASMSILFLGGLPDPSPDELFVGPLSSLPDSVTDGLLVGSLVCSARRRLAPLVAGRIARRLARPFRWSAVCPTRRRKDCSSARSSLPLVGDFLHASAGGFLVSSLVPCACRQHAWQIACRVAGWIACRPAR